jgi:hypothetical protein
MYDFSFQAGGPQWRPAVGPRIDGRKRLALITASPKPWGIDASYRIHPTTDRQDPRREPQSDRNAALADKGVLPEDRVTLSGQHLDEQPHDPSRNPEQTAPLDPPQGASDTGIAPSPSRSDGKPDEDAQSQMAAFGEEVTDSQEAEQIRDLKKRDSEVKAHEQAHMAAGGGLVRGGAGYTYEKGPDGAMYAVGGEVKIDSSPARTPDQTIRKAQQIRRAALAPAQPSGTDRAVAAAASQMEAQARAEKIKASASGDEAVPAEAASPEVSAAEAASSETQAGTRNGPTTEATRQNAPPSPFTAPAIQAYQAATTAFLSAQAISTFV